MNSVIVYRNPIEQFIWEGLMSVGFWVWVLAVLLSMVVLFQLQSLIIKRLSTKPGWRMWIRSASCDKVIIAVSVVIGLMAFVLVM